MTQETTLKVRYSQETGSVTGYFHDSEFDYSSNTEYQEMLTTGNYIKISKTEFQEKYSGKEMTVKNGILQEYISSDAEILQQAKNQKKFELNAYYSSDKCWNITLHSIGNNTSLTKTSDWFKINMPPCYDKSIMLFTNDGDVISYFLSQEVGKDVLHQITVTKSFEIKTKKINCEALIDACISIEDINAINIESSLGINRTIEIA